MDPATMLRIGSVRNAGDGCALLGTLRVAGRAESYTGAPFSIPAGSLVFSDGQTPNGIRCLAAALRASWFAADVSVLLTQWRYVPPPEPLRGPAADAWAHIEILSPPVLLAAGFAPPPFSRPLSWWVKHQKHPELELERDFLATLAQTPPLSDADARLLLARQPVAAAEAADGMQQSSILGRVGAVSGVLQSADGSGPAFVVDVAVGPAEPVPILVSGQRHLGVLVSLCLGDSLLVTDLRPATLADGGGGSVFMTQSTSRTYRVDEFDGLEESQEYVLPVP
ncbi:hypothetical protein H4R21_006516, partial [Coemansia helicoidea]